MDIATGCGNPGRYSWRKFDPLLPPTRAIAPHRKGVNGIGKERSTIYTAVLEHVREFTMSVLDGVGAM